MGKVRMQSPNGKVYEFDGKYVKDALAHGYTQDLSGPQQAAKVVADVLPAVTGTAGMIAGATGGSAVPGPGTVAGGFMGGAAGTGMGYMGQRAIYDMAGIQTNDDPDAMLGGLAGNMAEGGLQGAFGGVGSKSPSLTNPTMKVALGNAQPGIEEVLAKEGIEVSGAGRKTLLQRLRALKSAKRASLATAEQGGVRMSWKTLASVLKSQGKAVANADVIGRADEEAMSRALATLEEKLGPKWAGGQTSKLVSQYGDQMTVPKQLVEKGQSIGPTRLEEIRAFADKQVKAFEQMRKGQNVTDPQPMERAYRAIADRAREMLNKMPAEPASAQQWGAGTIGDLNARIGALSDADKALFQALKRSSRGRYLMAGASLAAGTPMALWQHNPEPLLLGLPVAALTHAATDPMLQSRLALAMRDPRVGMAATSALPRSAELLARLMGIGSPIAQPDATGGQP